MGKTGTKLSNHLLMFFIHSFIHCPNIHSSIHSSIHWFIPQVIFVFPRWQIRHSLYPHELRIKKDEEPQDTRYICYFLMVVSNTPEEQCKQGKVYLSSQLQGFQSILFGFTDSGPVMRQNIMTARMCGREGRQEVESRSHPHWLYLLIFPEPPKIVPPVGAKHSIHESVKDILYWKHNTRRKEYSGMRTIF
jgi:hypothetical protein